MAERMELITGGTGIVGAHVLLERIVAGARVRALYRTGSDRGTVRRVFRHYRQDGEALFDRITWVPGDLHDMDALKEAMTGVRHVYHAAALVSFDPRDDRALHRMNAEGTANVVNAALAAGVERLCHVSSTAAIGDAPAGELRHEDLPWTDHGSSPYSLSKHAAELEVYRGIAEGLDAVIVNPCIVLGPGAPGRSSMTLVERLARGTRFFPPGSNAVVDARDVASIMAGLMERGASGERYLLVGAKVDYRTLFTALSGALGRPAPHHAVPGMVLQLAWRLEYIRSLFGGRPLITRHTVQSGIQRRAWSARKAEEALGIQFRGLDEMARNVAAFVHGKQLY